MSFLSNLTNFTKNVGRGALDVFTLGGNELGHHFGGDWYKNLLDPIEKGFGANFEAGAAGGSSILGAQGLGSLMGGGTGVSAGSGLTPYMPTSAPNFPMAGSTLGPGGMFSNLNPMGASGAGMGGASGASSLATALKIMRMMPQGGGQQPQQNAAQQRQDQEMRQRLVYQMFPNLRPGQPIGQAQRLGGF